MPGVCIEAHDRAGLERLLRYCARPPFSMERLRQRGADLVYHCPKPQSGGKRADLVLTPLELIDRIAALVLLSAGGESNMARITNLCERAERLGWDAQQSE